MILYHVPAGKPCQVRRCGTTPWTFHTTTKTQTFRECGKADDGTMWVFIVDGYEMKIVPAYVEVTGVVEKRDYTPPERFGRPIKRQRGNR